MCCFISFPFEGECGSGGSSTGGSTGSAESGSIQSENYPNDYPASQVPFCVENSCILVAFVYALTLSVYDEKISLTALGRIKDRLQNLNSNFFNFLKIFHLFDNPGQDLRDQCDCRKEDQDELRCVQPREFLEMRLGLPDGIKSLILLLLLGLPDGIKSLLLLFRS